MRLTTPSRPIERRPCASFRGEFLKEAAMTALFSAVFATIVSFSLAWLMARLLVQALFLAMPAGPDRSRDFHSAHGARP